jgi:methylaspartate mutase epsilon subunit
MIGILGDVQVCGSRTIDEAHHIPTKEGSASSFRNARMFLNMLRPQGVDILDNEEVEIESQIMEKEVRAVLKRVLELGGGDVVKGTVEAVDLGILDQPYATSQLVKGRVLGVKDARGAARFYDPGNLPFSREILDFHEEKIREREGLLGHKVSYDTIIGDLTAISSGSIV